MRSPIRIDGFMLPDGTWFQSATAERNTTITTMNRIKPRQSRQMRARRSPVGRCQLVSQRRTSGRGVCAGYRITRTRETRAARATTREDVAVCRLAEPFARRKRENFERLGCSTASMKSVTFCAHAAAAIGARAEAPVVEMSLDALHEIGAASIETKTAGVSSATLNGPWWPGAGSV